tara:strand:+ start:283 stop:507 length:225 start_codon:yes stop_codon:yes gene_type:complete
MFYIAATICFLHIQTFAMPVCFEYAAIPYKFGKKAECDLKRDQLIDLLDKDLKERQISMVLYCTEIPLLKETNV